MRHTYHVVTPLSRYENLGKLIRMLQPLRVQWHVITDADVPFRIAFDQMWIHPHICPNVAGEFWVRCNTALNWFFDYTTINEHNRYCILNDDDAYEPDFFKKVDNQDGDVIVTSMDRGHKTPANVDPVRAHAASKLIPAADQMRPGYVGIEQLVASGRVMSYCRIPLTSCGDGEMLKWISENYPVNYVPDATVWFNYYEPGRWNK